MKLEILKFELKNRCEYCGKDVNIIYLVINDIRNLSGCRTCLKKEIFKLLDKSNESSINKSYHEI